MSKSILDKINKDEKLLLNIKECAEYMGIGEHSLRKITKEYEDFPKIQIGNTVYCMRNRVERWLYKHVGDEL